MYALVLMACTSAPPLTPDLAVTRFEQDPQALQAEIAALPDALERQALVLALAETFPGETLGFCELLEERARKRCEAANNRPHLSADKQPPEPLGALMQGWPSPWKDWPGTGSRSDALSRAKVAPNIDEAAAACHAQPLGRYRDECFFQAAEAREEPKLCLGAGGFAPNCLGHVARRTAEHAPTSDSPDWDAFGARVSSHDMLGQTATRYEDRVWALALRSATARAGSPGGHLADHLPEAALPHLRCGLALRLVQDQPQASLEDLRALLAARPAPSPARPDPGFALKPELRELDIDGEWVHLWDNAARPLLEGDADLELCLELARTQSGG